MFSYKMMIPRVPKASVRTARTAAGLAAIVIVADALLPPTRFEIDSVGPTTFQEGRVFYGIPLSGGEVDSCKVAHGSASDYKTGTLLPESGT